MATSPVSPFAQDFLDVCVQTVCWQPITGRDAYGLPTWGPVQTFQGRRVFKNTRVASYERGTKGQGPEVLSESNIIILAVLDMSYDDLCYIQGDETTGSDGSNILPPILSWGVNPDETGLGCFTKVFLGSANG